MKPFLTCFVLLALALLPSLDAADRPVIVAFGDSTTALRPPLVVYSSLLGDMIRHELGFDVEVVNAGVRGDTTRRAAERFDRDVLARNPRLVIIQFGINDASIDVWKTPPETEPRVPKAEYLRNLAHFLESCRQRKIQVVLMTPNPVSWAERVRELYGRPPYDPSSPDGFNVILRTYVAALRQLAAETNTPLVDVMRAHDENAAQRGPVLTDDGIHPNAAGQQRVADLLMQLLRAHPQWLAPARSQP